MLATLAFGVSSSAAASTTAARSTTPRATEPEKPPYDLARDARTYADLGAYGPATDLLRKLRRRVPPDADLEIALALYEARSGQIDSALARLRAPLLARALEDTVHSTPQSYSFRPEGQWINGKFDGWHWYVARARAELLAFLGRWDEARDAARRAVAARPLVGKEWLILAVCAGRAGDGEEAGAAARRAALLDPSLPEAQYLAGVFEWRAGSRAAAQARFRQAVMLDSTFRAAAFALVRSRLPGAAPDSLPSFLLTGIRETTLLTSPARPKMSEFIQMDVPAQVLSRAEPLVPDSLKAKLAEIHLSLAVLVDARGRIAAHDLPWFDAGTVPPEVVSRITAALPEWRFKPAVRNGEAVPSWTGIDLTIAP